MSKELVLVKPDDWHLHLRDGELMAIVLKDTARSFARALVMPNLKEPVSTLKRQPNTANVYWKRGQQIQIFSQ